MEELLRQILYELQCLRRLQEIQTAPLRSLEAEHLAKGNSEARKAHNRDVIQRARARLQAVKP